ncbi:MAG TPA: putative toxin-antitoxin system toxin component, PIN family [Lentisphaeria bacterium]|nr:MAG: putative toxin-antitoxin system toxin component, PIN family [Lentisphaerae bacterium GWF2_38_69]HBM17597.1 putative toxin-antitoxin system toxin component, PIN family [Lentisphaeria bacterium]
MIITLDTNVLYQALRNSKGASGFILNLFQNRKVSLALSLSVFKEYEDVLNRPSSLIDFKLSKKDIEDVLAFIAYFGKEYKIHYLLRPNLKDENDNIFIELATVSQSDYLITSNVRDFQDSDLKVDIKIVTPSEFVMKWRQEYEK